MLKVIIVVLLVFPLLIISQEKVEGVVLDSEGSNALGLSGASVYW